jgi:hypothetical protein
MFHALIMAVWLNTGHFSKQRPLADEITKNTRGQAQAVQAATS